MVKKGRKKKKRQDRVGKIVLKLKNKKKRIRIDDFFRIFFLKMLMEFEQMRRDGVEENC